MSLRAEPYWYTIPAPGQNRCASEGFLRRQDGAWLIGFGRQNGKFACVRAADGAVQWELDLRASASDVVTGDVDGDGRQEFVFGTSHGRLYAVGDGQGQARVVWTADLQAGVGAPILADLDADSRVEIACPTADGYVNVLSKGPAAQTASAPAR